MMIRTENLTKIFRRKGQEVIALHNVHMSVEAGSFVVIKGPSGSGKSTLLFILGGMLTPSSGEVFLDDASLYAVSDKERTRYRRDHMGYVFQSYYLLPYLSVLDNILVNRRARLVADAEKEARALAASLGMEERLSHKPAELSAGEKQRVALARALLGRPRIILADEPTGNLDPENARIVIDRLGRFRDEGGTVIMVSHDDHADRVASRLVTLEKGELKNEN